jgi:hypothetical protein
MIKEAKGINKFMMNFKEILQKIKNIFEAYYVKKAKTIRKSRRSSDPSLLNEYSSLAEHRDNNANNYSLLDLSQDMEMQFVEFGGANGYDQLL